MLMPFCGFDGFTYNLKPPIFQVILSCFSWEIVWEHGIWSFCYISVFQLFIRIESDDIVMKHCWLVMALTMNMVLHIIVKREKQIWKFVIW